MKVKDGKIKISPYFVSSESDLDEMLNWEIRDAVIKAADGTVIFEQKGVEFPKFWSDTAVAVTADKYFRGVRGTPERENSLKQICNRVIDEITQWGIEGGYFDEDDAEIFNLEMKYLIFNQYFAFNSPVWFNVGIDECPQVSACFIQGVEDDMRSIMDLAWKEAMIFKGGSGSGTNYSKLRACNELLSGGGKASGPVSFMRGYDAFSGVIKSGGKTRRAAKMAILDVSHPDILQFITSKSKEEQKAVALIAAGFSSDFNDEDGAYSSVAFQNENHAVRISDAFMRRVKEDGEWSLYSVKTGEFIRKYKAREIFMAICESAHGCGDPGIQYDDVINAFHTIPHRGKIRGTNPCSEYMSIDDSACNLGSHNLMRHMSRTKDGYFFDSLGFISAVRLSALAQEILINNASYPTEQIQMNVKRDRQLGVGYCNLGTLLMYCGLPYDSDEGRALAASITSLMTATVYHTSSLMAGVVGPFDSYEENADEVATVLDKHWLASKEIQTNSSQTISILQMVEEMWENCQRAVENEGLRNSQATLLAPTGTIGIMMDCDTTGVEPETSLIKYKTLVGGGTIKLVNKTIGHAFHNLGYTDSEVSKIIDYLLNNEELEKCPMLRNEHLPVFDCALGTSKSARVIRPQGHVKMLAAIQPSLSGGISKTVNLPSSSTVKDVYDTFMLAFDLGVKCITVYREGSKSSQPLNVSRKKKESKSDHTPHKRQMPEERKALVHKFSIGGIYKGYLTIGFYPDGTPGEIFIESAKAGSTMNGLLDCFATMVSIGLQHNVPLDKIVGKFAHISFAPDGFTTNPDIGYARSIVDYVARYLERYIDKGKRDDISTPIESSVSMPSHSFTADAPPCPRCGAIMVRSGTCYKCLTCGQTSGCS